MSWQAEPCVLPGDRPAGNPRGTRSPALACRGMVATSQPLASAAALDVLQAGGNAVDAAVTAAAVLSVVEPTMTGVGGDLFALLYDARFGAVRALNASGRAGGRAHAGVFANLSSVPARGPLSVTVPGVVDGWEELLREHGSMSLERTSLMSLLTTRSGGALRFWTSRVAPRSAPLVEERRKLIAATAGFRQMVRIGSRGLSQPEGASRVQKEFRH